MSIHLGSVDSDEHASEGSRVFLADVIDHQRVHRSVTARLVLFRVFPALMWFDVQNRKKLKILFLNKSSSG